MTRCTRAYIAVSPLAGGDRGAGGGRKRGRNTCTTATQQFRVKCYVSESVMPMWAEANLWNPVSAHM